MKILRKKTVAERVGTSIRTNDRWSNDPKYNHLDFPKQVSLGENSVGYIEDEIDDWIAWRASMREADKVLPFAEWMRRRDAARLGD